MRRANSEQSGKRVWLRRMIASAGSTRSSGIGARGLTISIASRRNAGVSACSAWRVNSANFSGSPVCAAAWSESTVAGFQPWNSPSRR